MGFDSGPPGSEPWELVRMAEGGLGALGALRAATAGGAAALARDDLGRLAVGAVADLVVLDGDPLGDPRVLVRPGRMRLVLQAGVPIAGRDLDPPRLDGRPAPAADSEMPEPVGTPTCCLSGGGGHGPVSVGAAPARDGPRLQSNVICFVSVTASAMPPASSRPEPELFAPPNGAI